MDKNSLHFKGTYRNVYEVNRAYPNGGVDGDYVDINGWQHWWNPDRGTWCVNENRDSYWDEVLSTVQNLLFSKACVSESDFPLNPTDEEKRFGYFYNGELYLWTGTNGTVRNGQYRSFGVVQGERGVGVSSIAQTSTSNVDGGKNEITVTLTNGDSYKFFTYNGTGRNKGYYYRTLDELKQAVPSPTVTDWAIVDGSVYVCDEAGVWKDTTYSWKPIKLNPFVTELNKMDMPTSTGYLYWNGQSFGWKTPVVNNGGGNTGGGTSIDLSEYSWWGRKFAPASKMITGEMSAVTSIEFQSTKGETTIRKKLYLDENGDLCFNGNLYATGGITALGSGGGTSGGGNTGGGTISVAGNGTMVNSAVSLLNIQYPSGLSDVVVSEGDGVVDIDLSKVAGSGGTGTTLSSVMSAMNSQLGKTSYGTPQFLYWNGSTYTWKNESEISGGSGGSNSRINKIKLFNYSGTSFETIELGTANTIGFMQGDNVTLQAVVKEYTNVIKISASGGSGSGSSGTTSGKLRFFKDSSEESWNGESDFKIIFGSGLNVTWDSHSQITLSATGGSSGGSSGGSVSWTDVTNKPSTFTPSSHTHSTNDITGLESYVKGTKVSNANAADRLANAVTLWGNSFTGNNSIGTTASYADLKYVKNIYAGDAFDIKAGNNSLLNVDTVPNIYVGFGYMTNNKASLSLFGNKTTIYTSGDDYRYDFKSNVFDVNSNSIHFGSKASGGKISWDAANNAFKIEGNLYATGGITALGVSNSATTSNNVDFTFKSVTITGNNNVQLTDDGLQVSKLGDMGAWYKKDSIIMYNENDDDSCEIFHFDNNQLSFDPNLYQFDIYFNTAISCNTVENTLNIGTGASAGYIVFKGQSTMRFIHNNRTFNFNVAKAIEQGILTV